ncbi:MAG TPA: CAP domain-containing protein [Candidatus Binatia bacterium]|nr:CAP domain-containing protein [Candidatus Binatia bacterium]
MKLKHYLIASPENGYRPWILTKTAMACFVLSIWALRAFLPSYMATSASGIDNQLLMNLVNEERTNRLLPALIINSKLNTAANIKSQDMIERSYFAHVNPDGDYVWPVIEAQGYKPYQSLGENLAMDFSTSEAVVNAWMNSPGHRANILNEKFEDQGMSAVFGEFEAGHSTYLITNLFGSLFKAQQSPSPTPSPTPAQTPSQSPAPTPTPQPSPAPSTRPNPTPTPSQTTPQPTPVIPEPTPSPTPTPTAIDPTPSPTPLQNPKPIVNSPVTTADSSSLTSLKILMGFFAALYTFFLVVDSIIIHKARARRENIPSSPHSLMLLLVSVTNFLTLWI